MSLLEELLDRVTTLYRRLSQNKLFQLIIGFVGGLIANYISNLIPFWVTFILLIIILLIVASVYVALPLILRFISLAKKRLVLLEPSKPVSTSSLPFLRRRWLQIVIFVLIGMTVGYSLRPFLLPNPMPPSEQHVRLCDGSCIIDEYRINGGLKDRASELSKQGDHARACAYWERAVDEDPTDGEAKIYDQDQCSSALANASYYINIVVAVRIVDDNDLMNSVNRAILQGVAERQREFNNAHPAGPKLYIILMNLANASSQTQQDAAQQIIDAANSRSHPIAGMIGSLFGLDTFVNTLSSASIPMISVAPVDDSTASHPYLLSVAPSFQEQASAAMRYMQNQAAQKHTTLHVALYFTSRTDDTYSRKVADVFRDTFRAANQSLVLVDDSAYTPTNMSDLVGQIKNLMNNDHRPDFIYLAGPSDDANQLQAALHREDIHVRVLTMDSMYQWIYQNHTPEVFQNFLGITFTASAYHHPDFIHDLTSPLSPECRVQATKPSVVSSQYNMVSDYKSFFDPGDVYFGSPYTHDLASSDTILAYDALSLVDAAPGIAKSSAAPTAKTLWTALEKFTPTNPFPGVSGQISFQENRSAPYQKAVLLINITDSGNNLIPIEHTSATIWAGCYQLYPA
jgi:ABC-type branched-subunit amino acid transport system substrate-binding protein